jgi:hypothetical protein
MAGYPTKKDGPVHGLMFAATRPLWAALLVIVIPVEAVRTKWRVKR